MVRRVFNAGIIAAKKERKIKKHVCRAFWSAIKLELVRWRNERRAVKATKKRFEEQCIFLNWIL